MNTILWCITNILSHDFEWWDQCEMAVKENHRSDSYRRRKLERPSTSTWVEADRVECRATCRNANDLITASRHRHRYQHIVELKGNSRGTWSAGENDPSWWNGACHGEPAENTELCNTKSCQQSQLHCLANVCRVDACSLSSCRRHWGGSKSASFDAI